MLVRGRRAGLNFRQWVDSVQEARLTWLSQVGSVIISVLTGEEPRLEPAECPPARPSLPRNADTKERREGSRGTQLPFRRSVLSSRRCRHPGCYVLIFIRSPGRS